MKLTNVILAASAAVAIMLSASDASAQGAPLVLDFNEVNVAEGGPVENIGPFIEIVNSGQSPQSLSNYRLATPDQSTVIELTDGVDLAAGDFWVVCGTAGSPVPNCDQMSADIGTILAEDTLTLEFDLSDTWLTEDSVTFGGLVAADPVNRSGVTTARNPIATTGNSWVLQCPDPGEENSLDLDTCGVVINEVDYDQGETDDSRFIELVAYDERGLDCAQVRVIDPNDDVTVFVFPDGTSLMTGEYMVICDSKDNTANCDFEFSETAEDSCSPIVFTGDIAFSDTGDHGVSFAFGDRIDPIDSLSYNGLVDSYTEGGVEAPSDLASPGPISISRVPDIGDTDVNGDDFVVACSTPGEANATDLTSCELCGTGVVEGDEECDEGATENTATCEVDCTAPACGDGIFNVAADEECDPSDPESPPCTDECVLEGAFARGSGGCSASSGAGLGGFLLLGLLLLAVATRRRPGTERR